MGQNNVLMVGLAARLYECGNVRVLYEYSITFCTSAVLVRQYVLHEYTDTHKWTIIV